jgi:hypothetical protein
LTEQATAVNDILSFLRIASLDEKVAWLRDQLTGFDQIAGKDGEALRKAVEFLVEGLPDNPETWSDESIRELLILVNPILLEYLFTGLD